MTPALDGSSGPFRFVTARHQPCVNASWLATASSWSLTMQTNGPRCFVLFFLSMWKCSPARMKLLKLYSLCLSLQDETNIQLVGASSRAFPEMLLTLTLPVSLSVKAASSLRHLLTLIQSTTPNLWAHKAVPGSWPITADRAVATKNLPQTEECRGLSPPLPPLSFSKPGCLACEQLPMLVWHLLCQHAWEKLIKRLALPLPHLPFPPRANSAARFSLTTPVLSAKQAGQNVFFFRAFPMLLWFRLAWCLLLSPICKCPRVLQQNPEHTCCRQRFYSLFVYRPLVANIVKVTVLSEWTNRFYWDGMIRFAASVPGMNQMCCAEFIAIGRFQLWSPVGFLCVFLSVLQNGKRRRWVCALSFFFVCLYF